MTAFVDTNILIRYLTGDPPDLAARAGNYMREADFLLLPDLILAEVAYVLTSFYDYDRLQVADALRTVITHPTIRVLDLELLVRTAELFERYRMDFADAYLVASAEHTGVRAVASFDRDIDRPGTVDRIEPS